MKSMWGETWVSYRTIAQQVFVFDNKKRSIYLSYKTLKSEKGQIMSAYVAHKICPLLNLTDLYARLTNFFTLWKGDSTQTTGRGVFPVFSHMRLMQVLQISGKLHAKYRRFYAVLFWMRFENKFYWRSAQLYTFARSGAPSTDVKSCLTKAYGRNVHSGFRFSQAVGLHGSSFASDFEKRSSTGPFQQCCSRVVQNSISKCPRFTRVWDSTFFWLIFENCCASAQILGF